MEHCASLPPHASTVYRGMRSHTARYCPNVRQHSSTHIRWASSGILVHILLALSMPSAHDTSLALNHPFSGLHQRPSATKEHGNSISKGSASFCLVRETDSIFFHWHLATNLGLRGGGKGSRAKQVLPGFKANVEKGDGEGKTVDGEGNRLEKDMPENDSRGETTGGFVNRKLLVRRRRAQERRQRHTAFMSEVREAERKKSLLPALRELQRGTHIQTHIKIKGGSMSSVLHNCTFRKLKEDEGIVKVELQSGAVQHLPIAYVEVALNGTQTSVKKNAQMESRNSKKVLNAEEIKNRKRKRQKERAARRRQAKLDEIKKAKEEKKEAAKAVNEQNVQERMKTKLEKLESQKEDKLQKLFNSTEGGMITESFEMCRDLVDRMEETGILADKLHLSPPLIADPERDNGLRRDPFYTGKVVKATLII